MFISNKNQAETVDNKGFLQSLSYQASFNTIFGSRFHKNYKLTLEKHSFTP